jgi:fluoroacetyl-CoA thioesterase
MRSVSAACATEVGGEAVIGTAPSTSERDVRSVTGDLWPPGNFLLDSVMWKEGSMDFENIKPGLEAENEITVEIRHTVSHTGTPVLSTPMMISVLELLAKDLVQELLPAGFTTVGYEVQVKHKSPSFLGARVKMRARLLEADGRKLLFEVRVTEGERVVGEGLHRRTIIPMSA